MFNIFIFQRMILWVAGFRALRLTAPSSSARTRSERARWPGTPAIVGSSSSGPPEEFAATMAPGYLKESHSVVSSRFDQYFLQFIIWNLYPYNSVWTSYANARAKLGEGGKEQNWALVFFKPHSHHNDFYWGRQCSWTLTLANSMQVSIMQFDNCNRK